MDISVDINFNKLSYTDDIDKILKMYDGASKRDKYYLKHTKYSTSKFMNVITTLKEIKIHCLDTNSSNELEI